MSQRTDYVTVSRDSRMGSMSSISSISSRTDFPPPYTLYDENGNAPRQQLVGIKLVFDEFHVELFTSSLNLPYLRSYFDDISLDRNRITFELPPLDETMVRKIVKTAMKDPPTYDKILCIESSFVSRYQVVSEFQHRCITTEKAPWENRRANDKANAAFLRYCSPWDFEVEAPRNGQLHKYKIASCEIFNCSNCGGSQKLQCHECYGCGSCPCEGCATDACDYHEVCEDCHGTGYMTCESCHGSNQVDCEFCETGKFEKYKQLNVETKEHQNDVYTDNFYDIPEWFLRNCDGTTIFRRASSHGYISPIAPDECLNLKIVEASRNLVSALQRTKNENCRLDKMTHTYSIIPIYKVRCARKRKSKEFWITGNNCKVFYPRRFK